MADALVKNQVDAPSKEPERMILVIDDDASIRTLLVRMFAIIGYGVIEAASGREALDIYKNRSDTIGLVLLDLGMPDMNGVETLDALRAIDAEVRIVVASGYADAEVTARFPDRRLDGVVQKPFAVRSLREALERAGDF